MRRSACFVAPMCLALAGCSGSSSDPANRDPEWTLPVQDQGGALLSVLAHEGDIFVAGTNGGNGGTVLRLSGGEWTSENTQTEADLWWIAPHPDGRLFVVGSDGTVLERSPDGDYTALDSPTDMTIYGVWFNAAGEGWAAAGNPLGDGMTTPRGALLRITDAGVELEAETPDALPTHLMFKVWGPPGQSEVAYAVGDGGYLLEWDGNEWLERDSGTNARLITIAGDESQRAIVGGTNQPTLLFDDGMGLSDISAELPVGAQGLNGVFIRDNELAVAGNLGFAALRDADGVWTSEYVGSGSLHAVSIDPNGELWAVGGNLLSLSKGYIAHYGTTKVPELD